MFRFILPAAGEAGFLECLPRGNSCGLQFTGWIRQLAVIQRCDCEDKKVEVKGKGQVLDIVLLHDERITISEVTADWHELMIPQRIMRPSIARTSEQLDPRCSMQTYHRPNQLH